MHGVEHFQPAAGIDHGHRGHGHAVALAHGVVGHQAAEPLQLVARMPGQHQQISLLHAAFPDVHQAVVALALAKEVQLADEQLQRLIARIKAQAKLRQRLKLHIGLGIGLIPAGQIHPLAVIVNLHGEGHDVIAKLNVHGRAHLAILHGNFNHRLAAFLGLQGGGAVAIQHAAQRAAVLRHGNLRAGRHILRGISQRRGAQQKGRRQRQQKQHDSFHYSFSQAALRARQQMAAAAVRQTASVR